MVEMQADSKIHMEMQGPEKVKTSLKKQNKGREFTLSDFKNYYKTTVIKIVSYWHKIRKIYQWNRIESSAINLCTYVVPSILYVLNNVMMINDFTVEQRQTKNQVDRGHN